MATTLATADILTVKRRRLDRLQQQAAAFGYSTPPEVANEIQDLQREIAAAAPETIAESHDILYGLLQETRADVQRILWIGAPILGAALATAVIALVLVLVLL
jgi:hypothetical protein